MTTEPQEATACPICGGPWWPDHPAGALTFRHRATCGWLVREDATHHADVQRFCDPWARRAPGVEWHGRTLIRPIIATEALISQALGWPQEVTQMAVRQLTNGLIRREPVGNAPSVAPTPLKPYRPRR